MKINVVTSNSEEEWDLKAILDVEEEVLVENQGVSPIRKKGASKGSSKDMASFTENRLTKVQQAIANALELVKDIKGRTDGLEIGSGESYGKPTGELKRELQGAFNKTIVEAKRNEIVKLKGELTRLKTMEGVLGTPVHHWNILELKKVTLRARLSTIVKSYEKSNVKGEHYEKPQRLVPFDCIVRTRSRQCKWLWTATSQAMERSTKMGPRGSVPSSKAMMVVVRTNMWC
ncbi:hypothetical protein PVK06_009265 [Gossypium arboreum]|uniref:Uncharacterized protein n=1 Tax=Gossypium arboreum TaxID=29729 RepID=A0ABR0QNF2_GOSAR|nr:hypothetical protein PVK06_009265 [Gossypium arboreum]